MGHWKCSCWKKRWPCPVLTWNKLYITGAGKTHNSTIHVLPFEVSLVAFQNVQPYILVHFGSSLSHHPMTLAHVGKIFMLLSSVTKQSAILDCYCMTYNESTGIVAGACFYKVCENIPKSQDDVLYHFLPYNVEELNSAMCGQFHRGRQ